MHLTAASTLLFLSTALQASASLLPAWYFDKATSTTNLAAAPTCNGHAELCSKSYADVVYIGAHNSYAVGDGVSDNQAVNITTTLKGGIRLIQGQAHENYGVFRSNESNPSELSLCHTSCLLQDGGSLEDYLRSVRAWLNENPREVLTILMTNPDRVDIRRWEAGFNSTGFNASNTWWPDNKRADGSYGPSPSRDQWPTLGEMIDQDKRVVIFLDYASDRDQVSWILAEFDSIYENPFDQLDLPFNCSVDRGRTEGTLALLNNNKNTQPLGSTVAISTPDRNATSTTNSADGENGIVSTVQRCASETRTRATFVLVDYWDTPAKNGVAEAAARLNNVSRPGSAKDMIPSSASRSIFQHPSALLVPHLAAAFALGLALL
ncbi:hypothetical protein IE81DRAFT_299040 [Ceraceosorus guamensis]|uniref:PLC-like phosphodiesterase n=1 Tax=Ceraceosorus guamensis TaxID=1522189 RepID=A0A316W8N9_9BASI|nr:hypothetical protein IE81DRAFT_299040 [Ceraceosorus guamensis]PWN44403.1 hypothetical protein IE81DRAFT_299040 [Ceraceosorus guamensis]